MSERTNTNSFEYSVEHNSCDTQLSDSQIRMLKQEDKYKPEYAGLLETHLQDGSFSSFAGLIKVNETVLYSWMRKYPEFAAVRIKYKNRKARLYA